MADGFVSRINEDPVDHLPLYAAQHERLFDLARFAPGATGLTAKPGRRLGAGLELSVAGDSSSVTVQPGVCIIGSPNATGGPYVAAVNVAKTITMPAKPGAGLQRRDLVVVRVYDEDVAEAPTTLREMRVELVTGTAAASPSPPAQPAMTHVVGHLNTTQTTTTIVPSLTDYTWAPGGIGLVGSQAQRDALAQYDGQVVFRTDQSQWQGRRGGAWADMLPTPVGITIGMNTDLAVSPGNNARVIWHESRLVEAYGGAALSSSPGQSKVVLPLAGHYLVIVSLAVNQQNAATVNTHTVGISLRLNSNNVYTGGTEMGWVNCEVHPWVASATVMRQAVLVRPVLVPNPGDHIEAWATYYAGAGGVAVVGGLPNTVSYISAVRLSA